MTIDTTEIKTLTELQTAYDGSYYTVLGVGGDLEKWVGGYTDWLNERGIGTPTTWLTTTGAALNHFAASNGSEVPETALLPLDLGVLMFPLDGLDTGKLAVFRIQLQDRWFDDLIDNMRQEH